MTNVFNSSKSSSPLRISSLIQYMIEAVSFNGDSETLFVEAYSEEQAQELVADLVPEADYIMVQGSWTA